MTMHDSLAAAIAAVVLSIASQPAKAFGQTTLTVNGERSLKPLMIPIAFARIPSHVLASQPCRAGIANGTNIGTLSSWGLRNSEVRVASSLRLTDGPSAENPDVGFRLASPVPVPEPASLGLAATDGLAALGWTMLSRRKRHAVRAVASLASQPMETTS